MGFQKIYYDAHLTIRCNPGNSIKLINESLSRFPNRLQLFRNTCFGRWLDLQCDNRDPSLIHLILQTEFVPEHEVDYLMFSVAGQQLTFTRRDFCLITGFRFGRQDWLSNRFGNPFRDRVFPSRVGHSIKGRDIRYVLESGSDSLDDVDHVRLCLLYLLHFGFYGGEVKNAVKDSVLVLLEDLNAWNQFPWGSYLWDETFPRLRNALGKRQALHFSKTSESRTCYSLAGFVWAFKVTCPHLFNYIHIYLVILFYT